MSTTEGGTVTDPNRPPYGPPTGDPAASAPQQGSAPAVTTPPGGGIGRTALIVVAVALVLELVFSVVQAAVVGGRADFTLINVVAILRLGLLFLLALTGGGLAIAALTRRGGPRTAALLALGAAGAIVIGLLSSLLNSFAFAVLLP